LTLRYPKICSSVVLSFMIVALAGRAIRVRSSVIKVWRTRLWMGRMIVVGTRVRVWVRIRVKVTIRNEVRA